MRLWILLSLMMGVLPVALAAQETTADATPGLSPAVAAAIAALPGPTVRRLRAAPDRFLQEAGRLIYGYGRDDGIDAAGLVRYIALQRAATRGRTLRAFLDADLDNDGAISRDEVSARAATLAANARGRLLFAHQMADLNRDGSVSWDEMRTLAQQDALAALSAEDEAVLLGFMGFDADKDGSVTMAEVQTMQKLFQPDL